MLEIKSKRMNNQWLRMRIKYGKISKEREKEKGMIKLWNSLGGNEFKIIQES